MGYTSNASVVRKIFGYHHIPQKWANQINAFNQAYLNPHINYHRPCFFPEVIIDEKGKERKKYPYKNMMTPYDKLRSLSDVQSYLKGIYSPPTPQSSKNKIKEWLEQNKIYCLNDCLKPELVEVLKKMAPEPIYAIDEIAASCGHKIIRTPPYHTELQPIETCWGVTKNHVGRNCDFTMKNLIKQLDCGFSKVTAKTCAKIIAKVREVEDEFWTADIEMDAQ